MHESIMVFYEIIIILTGGIVMSRGLDLNKLKNRPHKVVSSEEALKDVIPFEWSKEVLEGKKKVIISGVRKQ